MSQASTEQPSHAVAPVAASGAQTPSAGGNSPSGGASSNGSHSSDEIWGKLPPGKFIPLPPIDRPADLLTIDPPRVTPDEVALEAREKFVEYLAKKPGPMPTLQEVIEEAKKRGKLDALAQATAELDRESLDDVTRLLLSDEKTLAWVASEALKGGK